MTNPLTTLDELIWKQFEKVTNAAYKRYGWDKYDLAVLASDVANFSFGLMGAYIGYHGIREKFPANVIAGALLIPLGLFNHFYDRRRAERLRDKEFATVLKKGCSSEPQFSAERPVLSGMAAYAFYSGVNGLYRGNYPLIGISLLAGSVYMAAHIGYRYFLSQIPKPPSTAKKSLWQALADYVTKPFHKEQQPVEVPAAKYIAERVHL